MGPAFSKCFSFFLVLLNLLCGIFLYSKGFVHPCLGPGQKLQPSRRSQGERCEGTTDDQHKSGYEPGFDITKEPQSLRKVTAMPSTKPALSSCLLLLLFLTVIVTHGGVPRPEPANSFKNRSVKTRQNPWVSPLFLTWANCSAFGNKCEFKQKSGTRVSQADPPGGLSQGKARSIDVRKGQWHWTSPQLNPLPLGSETHLEEEEVRTTPAKC